MALVFWVPAIAAGAISTFFLGESDVASFSHLRPLSSN